MNSREIEELAGYLTPAEREELDALVVADLEATVWRPLPGPQTMAYNSTADVIGFGGAAGGGKGLALTTPIATPTGWTTMGALREGDCEIGRAHV